jgi:hypothetical protein
MGEDRSFRFLQNVSYARAVPQSTSSRSLPRGRRRSLPIDWLLAALAVLLALASARVAAPGAVCGTLVPSGSSTALADLLPLAVRDLGLPRDASVVGFGIAALLALALRPSLVGKLATAAVFVGMGVLTLVTVSYGIGILSCR